MQRGVDSEFLRLRQRLLFAAVLRALVVEQTLGGAELMTQPWASFDGAREVLTISAGVSMFVMLTESTSPALATR